MPDDFSKFYDAVAKSPRLLLEAELTPLQGNRFQPTGFADLGAAVYERPDGTRMCLVESAQSVANRLERAVLKGTGPDLASELDGLPYVRVKLTGEGEGIVTSSLVEAHRLNSPFIITDAGFQTKLLQRCAYKKGKPIDWLKAAQGIFYFDPCCLLHGVFFANVEDGRLRFPRALTGFIEAEKVEVAASGGVKNQPFDPSGTLRAEGYDKDVYGNVPYARIEYTAERIRAYFNLDLAQLRSHGLPDEGLRLLVSLAAYKIRRFLHEGLRLRTACDLALRELSVTMPEKGASLPDTESCLAALKTAIGVCRAREVIGSAVVDLETGAKWSKKERKTADPKATANEIDDASDKG